MIIDTKFVVLCTLSTGLIALSGCSGVRNSLGLDKDSPDEFAVITRAPLEMPPSLSLPAPQPGEPRPQEASVAAKAQEAVFGIEKQHSTGNSGAESSLLRKAGADQADPNIRATVNKETAAMSERNKPVIEKILKLGGEKQDSSATIVDAKKEQERIKANSAEGKAITDGETPVIEE